MTTMEERARRAPVRRGFALEWITLGWNVAGIIILAIAAKGSTPAVCGRYQPVRLLYLSAVPP